MSGAKDIVNFLLPVPPTVLIRQKEFPNCPEVFEVISKTPPDPRNLGRIFSRLCRMTGLAWLLWGFNTLAFCGAAMMFIYHWGAKLDMSEPSYLQALSCQMIVAILTALLFVGKLMFYAATTISLQLAERCYEHLNKKRRVSRKKENYKTEAVAG